MNQRLAVEPHRPTLGALACKRVRIGKIVEDPVERPDSRGARCQYNHVQRQDHAGAIIGGWQMKLVRQIIGSGNQAAHAWCRRDMHCVDHTNRRFDHGEHGLADCRRDGRRDFGRFNLGQDKQIG